MNNIANANQFFNTDTLHVQAVPNGAVILTVGKLYVTLTPKAARSLVAKLMAALLVAEPKQTKAGVLAAADKIRAEEF